MMSDELDRLSKAFRQQDETPPCEDARKVAISRAMKVFDNENFAKNAQSAQGMGIVERLRKRGNKIISAFNRRKPMNIAHAKLPLINFKHLLAGGASLAVLTFAVVNIDQILPEQGIVDTDKQALEQEADDGRAKAKPDREESLPRDTVAATDSGALKVESVVAAKPKKSVIGTLVGASSGRRSRAPQGEMALGGNVAPLPAPGVFQKRIALPDASPAYYQDRGRDKFEKVTENPTRVTKEDPVSTFSVDVDTASYSFVRSALNRGVLPQMNAVRVEEMINYFNYHYQAPQDRSVPFKASVSIMPTPWNQATRLMRVGIKGYSLPKGQAPHANLVFLIDTSGSMYSPDKLPLLRNSFKLLLQSLKPDDTVSIVTYAGSAGMALAPTRAGDKNRIMAALDQLDAGGSTAGAEGIRLAYQLAEQQMKKGGVNRVILATDGDFNVGISNTEELKSFIARKRKTGVTLSVLGFGHGNYNDQLMQTLAQNGNGNAAYIDSLSEARKVLVEEAGSTLFTIAKDVKLQVEFNPARVAEYRLIGYETRQLKREDFNNDKVDAGDIGAGHTVTALYEITPVGAGGRLVDELRYKVRKADEAVPVDKDGEYAFLKIRYKLPKEDKSRLITIPVTGDMEVSSIDAAQKDTRFAAAVAAFGQILRGGRNMGDYSYDDVIRLAQSARGEDRFGYRVEFINLVRLAKSAAAMAGQRQ